MEPDDGRPTPGAFWVCGNCQELGEFPFPRPEAFPRPFRQHPVAHAHFHDIALWEEDPDARPYIWDVEHCD